MDQLRDYVSWHRAYDDPSSGLSWRLGVVQRYLNDALDRRAGAVRLLSLCSGDGRDVIDVLSHRSDADRVSGVLVELHPQIAAEARSAVSAAKLDHQLEVRTGDASVPGSYADAVPADLVLLVGIFGNISEADLWRTIDAASALCLPGATLVWSRGRHHDDLNDAIRARFIAGNFSELAYDARDDGSRPALGALRYDGLNPQPLTHTRLFTFLR